MLLRRLTVAFVAVTAAATAMAGCGGHAASSSGHPQLPSAAGPSRAAPLASTPAGHVISVPTGSSPEGVAVDDKSRTVTVALGKPSRVALVDETTRQVRIRQVPGKARHLVLAGSGGPVLLPAEDTDRLLQLQLPGGRVGTSTTLPRQPHNAAVIGGNFWVADELAPAISVVSPDGTILATMHGPVQPGGVAAAAGTAGAVDVRGATMTFYDAASYRSLGRIPLGAGPTHAVTAGGNYVAVADTRGGAVLLVDMVARRVVSRVATGAGPYGMASDPSSGDIWITLTQSNRVLQFHRIGSQLRQVKSWPTVRQPNTVGVDPRSRCLYVAGVVDSNLDVICPA